MEGFFRKEELNPSTPRVSTIEGCGACGLHKQCRTPKFSPAGLGEKNILIIAEQPSVQEDKRGELNTGSASQLLRTALRKNGIDLDVDCIKINAVSCCPPEDEDLEDVHINNCRPRVWNQIKKMKPALIILLGSAAVKSFLGHRWKKKLDGIAKWRGWCIPDRDVNCWVCPTFHPSYIEYMDKNPAVETIWLQDIKRAISCLKTPLPYYTPEKQCIRTLEGRELYNKLLQLNKQQMDLECAFDYETTGLKPHRKGHKIVCCAIAEDENSAFNFLMPTDERTLSQFKAFLRNRNIAKIAANMKYEHTWSKVILNTEVQGWFHDTMLTAHMLDNRKHITGLKFQTYVRFGIVDYDSSVSDYLQSKDDKDANSFNKILEAPKKELLYYCGMDALLEFRLYRVQQMELRDRGFY